MTMQVFCFWKCKFQFSQELRSEKNLSKKLKRSRKEME